MRRKRNNGAQCPWSPLQVFTVFLYLCVTSVFLILSGSCTKSNNFLFNLLFVLVSSLCICVCWICVEVADTEKRLDTTHFVGIEPINYYHFCSICFKHIEGIDHHCRWLNCCIAKSNYRPFLLLVFILKVQMVFQFATGLVIQSDDSHSHKYVISLIDLLKMSLKCVL